MMDFGAPMKALQRADRGVGVRRS